MIIISLILKVPTEGHASEISRTFKIVGNLISRGEKEKEKRKSLWIKVNQKRQNHNDDVGSIATRFIQGIVNSKYISNFSFLVIGCEENTVRIINMMPVCSLTCIMLLKFDQKCINVQQKYKHKNIKLN